jgi:hypothetical protein
LHKPWRQLTWHVADCGRSSWNVAVVVVVVVLWYAPSSATAQLQGAQKTNEKVDDRQTNEDNWS